MKHFTPGLLPIASTPRFSVPLLAAAETAYRSPRWISVRGSLLPASDQGSTPHCAAYSVTAVAEKHNWSKGRYEQLDADAVYARAKQFDGHPDAEGTTIEAAVTAAEQLGLLRLKPGSLRMIGKDGCVAAVMRAIHQYDFVLGAFGTTTEWLRIGRSGWIRAGGEFHGPHAVPLFGFDNEERTPWIEGHNSWGATFGNDGNFRIAQADFAEMFYYGYVFEFAD